MNKNKIGPNKGTFKRILGLVFKENLFKVILVLILMMASTFSNVYAMSSVQNILEAAGDIVKVGDENFSEVVKLIVRMIIFYGLSITLTYTHLRIMVDVGQDTLLHIRTNLFDHMMSLPLAYFDTNKDGDLMSRYTNDVDATRQMISQSLPQLTVSILMMTAYLTMMNKINF